MSREYKNVVRIDRSPMNPKIWVVQLDCGHDAYKPGRKPTAKTYFCERCTERSRAASPHQEGQS